MVAQICYHVTVYVHMIAEETTKRYLYLHELSFLDV